MQTVLTQPEHCSHSGLLHRGWTDAAIVKFLKAPDKEVPNPYYRKSPPMKLYSLERVEAVEKSTEYQEFYTHNKTRRDASAKAVKTKREKLLKQVARWEIYIHPRHLEEVVRDAVTTFNSYRPDRSDEGFSYEPARTDSDKEFLNRITVNFLRHQCTPYERRLDDITGKVGTREAYILLNECIYRRISELYPELKPECNRQLEDKITKLMTDPLFNSMYVQQAVGQTDLGKF
jgi:hypothetical protein